MQLRVDTETAFGYLHRYATRTSVPLREVAARVAGGALRLQPAGATDTTATDAGGAVLPSRYRRRPPAVPGHRGGERPAPDQATRP